MLHIGLSRKLQYMVIKEVIGNLFLRESFAGSHEMRAGRSLYAREFSYQAVQSQSYLKRESAVACS